MSQPAVRGLRSRARITTKGWPIRRWAVLLTLIGTALLGGAIIGGIIALDQLGDARSRLIEQTDPQLTQANELSTSLLNQQTGVRGYLLAGQREFLAPYEQGRRHQDQAVAELRRLGAVTGTEAGADLDEVLRRARMWQELAEAWTVPNPLPSTAEAAVGKVLFDAIRTALDNQRMHLEQAWGAATEDLRAADAFLRAILTIIAGLLVLLFVILLLGFHRTIGQPVFNLAAEVRAVAEDDIHRNVQGSGPRELVELGADIEAMRQRIVDEVIALHRAHELLDIRTQELQRSNSDLEQFAYVASHDLQEPLRKVASFCQLLQRRYQGELDERGDQYIQFAVNGAKRMQSLINDLLAFSRVGRKSEAQVVVDTGELFDAAISNVEPVIMETGAQITRAELPKVQGEATLLTGVFQNLINNALKFHGEQPPQVHVDAHRLGSEWIFSVTDHGIGIEPEYAERIFVIFQRLHSKSAYPGTGIGLAMCRKIIDYHGGRIWLETGTTESHTRFCFTVPMLSVSDGENKASNEIEDA